LVGAGEDGGPYEDLVTRMVCARRGRRQGDEHLASHRPEPLVSANTVLSADVGAIGQPVGARLLYSAPYDK